MKKIILILTVVLIISLCSCQDEKTISDVQTNIGEKAVEIIDFSDISDSAQGSNLDSEKQMSKYQQWARESITKHYDTGVPTTASVTFMGKTYEGTYKESSTFSYATYKNDRYTIADGGIWFDLNHDTGELVSIILSTPAESAENFSNEKCRTIADKFVKEHIDSPISDYSVTESEDEGENAYLVDYDKYCGAIKTNESITVHVSKYTGEIIYFNTVMLNEYDLDEFKTQEKSFSALIKKSDEKIASKISSLYEKDETYSGYEIDMKMLCKLPDGGYGIISDASANFDKLMTTVLADGSTSEVICRTGELKTFLVKYEDGVSE